VLKQRVMLRGFSAVDLRTAAARDMLRWGTAVLAELGPSTTALQRARVETATRTRLLLGHLDAHLIGLVTLFPKAKGATRAKLQRRVLGLVTLRQQMADALDRTLWQLSGGPKTTTAAPPPPAIEDLIAAARQGDEPG
jgi:hypothetical protein